MTCAKCGGSGLNPFGGSFRNYSHLWEEGPPLFYANASKGEKPRILEFLRRPHKGAWFAGIADSGQKHLLPWVPLNAPGQRAAGPDYDASDMPTFGGAEPKSTVGIYSWDARRLLRQTHAGWATEARSDVYRVSLDNGLSYHYASDLDGIRGEVLRLSEAIAAMMDDTAREYAHGELTGDVDAVEFLRQYMAFAPCDLVVG